MTLREAIGSLRVNGRDKVSTRCPGHDDRRASLQVARGDDGRILLHCFAGCGLDTILGAAGLTVAELFPDAPRNGHGRRAPGRIVATYDYRDEGGLLLYQSCRFDDKAFTQRRPNGAGAWLWTLGDVRRVLYRLEKIQGAATVWLVEGEKDADRLASLGLASTTNPMGAGKWRPEYARQLTAASVERVIVLPDNDDPGRVHARTVAASCHAAGLAVQIVDLPDLPPKGDVSDYLEAGGHTLDDLRAIVAAAPPYAPTATPTEGGADCPVCGRDNCEDHVPGAAQPFDDRDLADAVDVALQGRTIADRGVPYVLDGLVPAYGMLGFIVAFAKVGKTTFGQALAAHVAMGRPFLERATAAGRVLVLAAEDPPEYTAWLARHLEVERGRLTFRCVPLVLTPETLAQITATVRAGGYGLVLIASWQAVIRGLVKDENDNAGAVRVVEDVKAAARASGVPWLIDAHSGKGEDQDDDADPSKAMRGASAAAGSADFTLSLRYGNGTFGTQRRLSGKGRFVSVAPIVMDFDATTSTYTAVAGSSKDVTRETTWRLITEVGAIDDTPRSAADVARLIGLVPDGQKLAGGHLKRIREALKDRPDVAILQELRRGQKTTFYRRLEGL